MAGTVDSNATNVNTLQYTNDVLHYILVNSGRASRDSIVAACRNNFTEPNITEAKELLLLECKIILNDINNDLLTKMTKKRRRNSNRDVSNIIL